MSGVATGIVAAVLFTGVVAGADRLRVHKDAGKTGVCFYKPGEPYPCDGDLAEKDTAVLVTADEIDRMVQGAKDYCDAQIAKEQAEFIKALEAQKAEILKELSQSQTKAPTGP